MVSDDEDFVDPSPARSQVLEVCVGGVLAKGWRGLAKGCQHGCMIVNHKWRAPLVPCTGQITSLGQRRQVRHGKVCIHNVDSFISGTECTWWEGWLSGWICTHCDVSCRVNRTKLMCG